MRLFKSTDAGRVDKVDVSKNTFGELIDLYKLAAELFLSCIVECVMNGADRNWREALVEAYPDLFHPAPDHRGAAAASPECGEGWRDLLDRACVRIRAAVEADGGSFEAQQLKEKYGTLRFYWGGRLSETAKAQVEEAIDLAEARSACTCEICGREGRLYDRGGWLATACPEHARGEPVPVKVGCETFTWSGAWSTGGVRIVSCRRYDRNADAFVDVDPHSLGIEE